MKIGIKRGQTAPASTDSHSSKRVKFNPVLFEKPKAPGRILQKKLTPEERQARRLLPSVLHRGPCDFDSQKRIIISDIATTVVQIRSENIHANVEKYLEILKNKILVYIHRFGRSAQMHLEIYIEICKAPSHYETSFAFMYVLGYIKGILSMC